MCRSLTLARSTASSAAARADPPASGCRLPGTPGRPAGSRPPAAASRRAPRRPCPWRMRAGLQTARYAPLRACCQSVMLRTLPSVAGAGVQGSGAAHRTATAAGYGRLRLLPPRLPSGGTCRRNGWHPDLGGVALGASVVPALEIGIDDLVAPGDHAPTRLGLPRRRGQRRAEHLAAARTCERATNSARSRGRSGANSLGKSAGSR